MIHGVTRSPRHKSYALSQQESGNFGQGRPRSSAPSSGGVTQRMPGPSGVRVEVTTHFQRAFENLPTDLQQLTVRRIALFASDPFDPRLRTHKLKGKLKACWSFSVIGGYRVLVTFPQPGVALLHDVGTHDIYR